MNQKHDNTTFIIFTMLSSTLCAAVLHRYFVPFNCCCIMRLDCATKQPAALRLFGGEFD